MTRLDIRRAEAASPPTLLQVLSSVFSAFFGVQSSRNRKRDFTHGNPWIFLLVGVFMTVLVVLSFYVAVRLALHLSVSG